MEIPGLVGVRTAQQLVLELRIEDAAVRDGGGGARPAARPQAGGINRRTESRSEEQ
jgi:hypothetical protein